jgi:prevent-host-death family protein
VPKQVTNREALADSKCVFANEQHQTNEQSWIALLTSGCECDYSDYMTTTLREAKAKFSEMVKRASRGEEVVITVHGKETAKLVSVPKRPKRSDKEKWLKELDRLREENWTGRYGKSAQEIQDEDRADRL